VWCDLKQTLRHSTCEGAWGRAWQGKHHFDGLSRGEHDHFLQEMKWKEKLLKKMKHRCSIILMDWPEGSTVSYAGEENGRKTNFQTQYNTPRAK